MRIALGSIPLLMTDLSACPRKWGARGVFSRGVEESDLGNPLGMIAVPVCDVWSRGFGNVVCSFVGSCVLSFVVSVPQRVLH